MINVFARGRTVQQMARGVFKNRGAFLKLLTDKCAIIKSKEDVKDAVQIPDKIKEDVYVEVKKELAEAIYNKQKKILREAGVADITKLQKQGFKLLFATVRKLLGVEKARKSVGLIKKCAEKGKVIAFVYHLEPLKKLKIVF